MSPVFPEIGPVSYSGFKEDAVVEQPAAEVFASLGWEVQNWQGEGHAAPDCPAAAR